MELLGGLDSLFLACETPTTHMHVCGVLTLDTTTMPKGDPFDHIRAMLVDRLPQIPPLRHVLGSLPFGIGRPFWIDDPQMDIDRHLHRLHLDSPDDHVLAEAVAEIASKQLPRDRPLWEIWVVDGIGENRTALIAKMHHATIDGVSGASLMGNLFDLTPTATHTDRPEESTEVQGAPNQLNFLLNALRQTMMEPVELLKLVPVTAGLLGVSAAGLLKNRAELAGAAIPFRAPRTRFNSTITANRCVAFKEVPTREVKRVKDAFGVKMNDLLTAIVGGGLRRYLEERDDLPINSLIAAEPVSAHEQAQDVRGTTKVSLMFANLRTDIVDPIKRLEAIAVANNASKQFRKLTGDDFLLQWAEHLWTRAVTVGMRLYSNLRVADYHPVVHNVIVSNVAGPPIPLYLAGARLLSVYPLGPIVDGVGMNVTVFTGEDNVGFGVVACPELVPDVWDVVDCFSKALAELSALAPVA